MTTKVLRQARTLLLERWGGRPFVGVFQEISKYKPLRDRSRKYAFPFTLEKRSNKNVIAREAAPKRASDARRLG